MITGLDAANQSYLRDVTAVGRRIDRAQRELSSGKRIEAPSDDPDSVSGLLQYHSELAMNQQTSQNLGLVKSEVDSAESAIASAVQLVQNARVLATQGATSTSTAATRATLADQAGAILQQLVSVANTTTGGRYLFSGDSDQTPAYTIDLTQTSPISAYGGTASTRQVADATGYTFSVGKTAQDLFDGAGTQSVFGAINELRIALQSNDQAGIATAGSDIDTSATYLNAQHAFYGSAQDRLADAIAATTQAGTRLQAEISGIEDADSVQSAMELNTAIYARSTALSARAKVGQNSLFDYLG